MVDAGWGSKWLIRRRRLREDFRTGWRRGWDLDARFAPNPPRRKGLTRRARRGRGERRDANALPRRFSAEPTGLVLHQRAVGGVPGFLDQKRSGVAVASRYLTGDGPVGQWSLSGGRLSPGLTFRPPHRNTRALCIGSTGTVLQMTLFASRGSMKMGFATRRAYRCVMSNGDRQLCPPQ
jgi:hypothetical protein